MFWLLAYTPATISHMQEKQLCTRQRYPQGRGEQGELPLAGGGAETGGNGKVIPSTATDCAETCPVLLNACFLIFKIILAPFCYCSAVRFVVETVKGHKIFYSKHLLVYVSFPSLRRASLQRQPC